MEKYNALDAPLFRNPRLREIQEKVLRKEKITNVESIFLGRDHPVCEINGYNLRPDYAYRAINKEFLIYINKKVLLQARGIGGVDLKYGDIVLECPAYKDYFVLAYDNGNGMSCNPNVKFIKSSGSKNPIPISMITNVFYLNHQKNDIYNCENNKVK